MPLRIAPRLRKHLDISNTHGLDYDVVSNPEFLREGTAVEDFCHPDCIVVGAESQRAIGLMEEIYRPVLNPRSMCPVHSNCPVHNKVGFIVTDANSAELVQHASNGFLTIRISFISMSADLCETAGTDIKNVAQGIGMDRRIGLAFLCPGTGFGGFCFPRDLQAFVHIGGKLGCNFSLLKKVANINVARVDQFVVRIKKEQWELCGKTIAV